MTRFPNSFPLAAFVLATIVPPTWGAITFTGPISPTGPGDGNVEVTLEIGEGNNPNNVDPRATVRVDGASTLEFDEVYVGSDEGFFGRLFVSGEGTKMTIEEGGSTVEPALQVGRTGDGYLLVDQGAWLDVLNNAGDLTIGNKPQGVGRMMVRDAFSFVSVGQNMTVGDQGIGRLDLLSGALLRTEDSVGASFTIGATAGGAGEVYVDGIGTRLRVGDDLVVGGAGLGTLTISNQAIVDADNSASPLATIGQEGRVTLDSGTFLIQTLAVNGVLGGSGLVRGDTVGTELITVAAGGRVEADAGELLQLDIDVNNQGTVSVGGGEIEMLEAFTNNAQGAAAAPGRVTLESGRVRFTEGLVNNGVVAATEGSSDIHGEVTNNAGASVIVARDAVATFYDAFTDNGGTLSVLGGGNALFLADLTFQAASALVLGLDTDPQSNGGAPIGVTGMANLAGDLTVQVPSDYVATLGDTFVLLEASEGVNGGFATSTLPDLPGNLEFGLLTLGDTLQLEVRIETVSFLEGDFNNDGTVDAADYTVWRDGLGTVFSPEDYNVWVSNFGQTAPTSQSESVPEPATLALVLLGGLLLKNRSHRGW